MIIQIIKFPQKERFVIMAKDLSTSTNSRWKRQQKVLINVPIIETHLLAKSKFTI